MLRLNKIAILSSSIEMLFGRTWTEGSYKTGNTRIITARQCYCHSVRAIILPGARRDTGHFSTVRRYFSHHSKVTNNIIHGTQNSETISVTLLDCHVILGVCV